jgi:hypothetical protein
MAFIRAAMYWVLGFGLAAENRNYRMTLLTRRGEKDSKWERNADASCAKRYPWSEASLRSYASRSNSIETPLSIWNRLHNGLDHFHILDLHTVSYNVRLEENQLKHSRQLSHTISDQWNECSREFHSVSRVLFCPNSQDRDPSHRHSHHWRSSCSIYKSKTWFYQSQSCLLFLRPWRFPHFPNYHMRREWINRIGLADDLWAGYPHASLRSLETIAWSCTICGRSITMRFCPDSPCWYIYDLPFRSQ